MANQKPRVSRHNGRAGKHGVYNPKHNDRQFDVAHAENIHQDRTRLNLYWDWQNGLRNHEENQSGQYPTFNQVERDFYEQRYPDQEITVLRDGMTYGYADIALQETAQ